MIIAAVALIEVESRKAKTLMELNWRVCSAFDKGDPDGLRLEISVVTGLMHFRGFLTRQITRPMFLINNFEWKETEFEETFERDIQRFIAVTWRKRREYVDRMIPRDNGKEEKRNRYNLGDPRFLVERDTLTCR